MRRKKLAKRRKLRKLLQQRNCRKSKELRSLRLRVCTRLKSRLKRRELLRSAGKQYWHRKA